MKIIQYVLLLFIRLTFSQQQQQEIHVEIEDDHHQHDHQTNNNQMIDRISHEIRLVEQQIQLNQKKLELLKQVQQIEIDHNNHDLVDKVDQIEQILNNHRSNNRQKEYQMLNRIVKYQQVTKGVKDLRVKDMKAIELRNGQLIRNIVGILYESGLMEMVDLNDNLKVFETSNISQPVQLISSLYYDEHFFQVVDSNRTVHHFQIIYQRKQYTIRPSRMVLNISESQINNISFVDNIMLRGDKYLFVINGQQNLYLFDRNGQIYKQIDFEGLKVTKLVRNYPYLMVQAAKQVFFFNIFSKRTHNQFKSKPANLTGQVQQQDLQTQQQDDQQQDDENYQQQNIRNNHSIYEYHLSRCDNIFQEIVDMEVDSQQRNIFYVLLENNEILVFEVRNIQQQQQCNIIMKLNSFNHRNSQNYKQTSSPINIQDNKIYQIRNGLVLNINQHLQVFDSQNVNHDDYDPMPISLRLEGHQNTVEYKVIQSGRQSYLVEIQEQMIVFNKIQDVMVKKKNEGMFSNFKFPVILISIFFAIGYQMWSRKGKGGNSKSDLNDKQYQDLIDSLSKTGIGNEKQKNYSYAESGIKNRMNRGLM